jgi:hypothetical protein
MIIDYQVPFNKQPSHVSLSKSFGLQELFLPFAKWQHGRNSRKKLKKENTAKGYVNKKNEKRYRNNMNRTYEQEF